MNLFNLCSKMILMELDDLPRIGVHNLNNICNTDDAVLMAVWERKKNY